MSGGCVNFKVVRPRPEHCSLSAPNSCANYAFQTHYPSGVNVVKLPHTAAATAGTRAPLNVCAASIINVNTMETVKESHQTQDGGGGQPPQHGEVATLSDEAV